MIAIGTIAPVVSYLGNKVGYKNLFVYGLIGLTVFSALCGYSWNIGSLITFRILQGICSGLIQISTMTIIYQSVKKEKQSMAISYWTISIMVAPAIGPTLGGLVVNSFGWEALFFSIVPIGVIAVICAVLFIPSSKDSKNRIARSNRVVDRGRWKCFFINVFHKRTCVRMAFCSCFGVINSRCCKFCYFYMERINGKRALIKYKCI